MIRNHWQSGNRSAFTLVEMMMVLLIIIALVGLLAGAAVKAMMKIPEVKTRVEIGEMDAALASFMADYNLSTPPPSSLLIVEHGYNPADPLQAPTARFFQQWFGKSFILNIPHDWNGNGVIDPPYILTGQQCLVFYLGGIPTYSAPGVVSGMTGFSPNVADPALKALPGARRKGPYFNFETSRLVLFGGVFPIYYDAWQVKLNPQAYAFFSSQGNVNGYSPGDCGSTIALPYYELAATGLPNYTNNNGYQIISAGYNGLFGGVKDGTGTAYGAAWSPASGATGHGADDQANFSSGMLGTGQH